MAKRSHEYVVAAPVEALRQVLADVRQVGRALAFVEETVERAGRYEWRLRLPMAALTGAESLTLTAWNPGPGGTSWQAESPRLTCRGELRLAEGVGEQTHVGFTLEMAGIGAAAAVIEPLAALQIEGRMDHFIDRLGELLQPALQPEEPQDVRG